MLVRSRFGSVFSPVGIPLSVIGALGRGVVLDEVDSTSQDAIRDVPSELVDEVAFGDKTGNGHTSAPSGR
jgi:hypothetical protein